MTVIPMTVKGFDNKNSSKAISFLKAFRKQGTINLVAIHPQTGEVTGITRDINHADIVEFVENHNNQQNLYFTVNEPFPNAPDTKLSKSDIQFIHAIYLDADPSKDKDFNQERQRLFQFSDKLAASNNPPTYIIDSGGGHQAFWCLSEKRPAADYAEHAEELCRGLATEYDTDSVHNIDRIMRIPFTTNIPDERKRRRGRQPAPSKVLHVSDTTASGKRYTDFRFVTPIKAPEYDDVDYQSNLNMNALPGSWQDVPDLQEKLRNAFKTDQKLRAIWLGEIEKPSRSEYDYALTQRLKMAGWSLEETAAALWLFPYGKNTDLNKREIIRCYHRAQDPFKDLRLDSDTIKQIDSTKDIHAPITEKIATQAANDTAPKRLSYHHGGKMQWQLSGTPLLKGLVDQKSIIVIYGQSNVGKSFLALDMSGHVAAGKDWGTYKLKQQMAVLYICAEAGQSFGKRLEAFRRKLKIPYGSDLSDFPLATVTQPVNYLKEQQDIIDTVLLVKQLERESGYKVGMVVVDTLATSFAGGNENSSEDMGAYINNMKLVQEMAGVAVMLVHHSGKDQAAGARGHSSLRAATDTEFEVVAEEVGRDRYRRELVVRKQREGASNIRQLFGLTVCELGQDEDGDSVTTCSVSLDGDFDFEDVTESLMDDLDGVKRQVAFANKIASNSDMNDKETKLKIFTYLKENPDILENTLSEFKNSMSDYDGILDMKITKSIRSAYDRGARMLETLGLV